MSDLHHSAIILGGALFGFSDCKPLLRNHQHCPTLGPMTSYAGTILNPVLWPRCVVHLFSLSNSHLLTGGSSTIALLAPSRNG